MNQDISWGGLNYYPENKSVIKEARKMIGVEAVRPAVLKEHIGLTLEERAAIINTH